MAFITWKEPYSVGIRELDAQHKKMINLINELNEAMRKGEGNKILGKILNELIAYADTHFESEEQLFTLYKYPYTFKHQKEHSDFKKEVSDFKEKYDSGNAFLSVHIMNFLKDWLINHILGSDKQYGPFLNSKGLK